MLVATMNPCPCGYFGDANEECTCSSGQILAYQARLSGPLIDRIDLRINVSRVPNDILLDNKLSTNSQHLTTIKLINNAHTIQRNRYESSTKNNNNLSSREIKTLVPLTTETIALLKATTDQLNLSACSYFKIIKVARTIADLESAVTVTNAHISEALQYRQ